MNEHHYNCPEMDPGFHINIPKGNNLPIAFGGNDLEANFPEDNFSIEDSSYYSTVNPDSLSEGQSGNVFTNVVQDTPSTVSSNIVASTSTIISNNLSISEPNCVSYHNISGETFISDNNQQYCAPAFLDPVLPPTLTFPGNPQAPQESQFISSVGGPQETENQFQPRECPMQNKMFADGIPFINDGIDSSISTSHNESISNFASTSTFIDCATSTQSLYPPVEDLPVVVGNDDPCNVDTGGSCSGSSLHADQYPSVTQVSVPPSKTGTGSSPDCSLLKEPIVENSASHIHDDNSIVASELHSVPVNSSCQDQNREVSSTATGEDLNPQQKENFDSYPNCAENLELTVESTNNVLKLCHEENNVDISEKLKEPLEVSSLTMDQPQRSVKTNAEETCNETAPHLLHNNEPQAMVESLWQSTTDVGQVLKEKTKNHDETCRIDNPSVCEKTLDDLTNSLEEGIKATSEISSEQEKIPIDDAEKSGDPKHSSSAISEKDISTENSTENTTPQDNELSFETGGIESSKPPSPMITVMDGSFGDGEDVEKVTDSSKGGITGQNGEDEEGGNVRLTRTRTGALRNKTRRIIAECDVSDGESEDCIPLDGWEYEEGAEIAPCTVDPSIIVREEVLKVTQEELDYYHKHFPNGIELVFQQRLHCTACGKHVGCAPNKIHLGLRHKVLRVLICNQCRSFYGKGKFPKDSDGSELFCRWCGQGGEVVCCGNCPNVFCQTCIKRNFGVRELNIITQLDDWSCFLCNYEQLWLLRSVCWALLSYAMQKKKAALNSTDSRKLQALKEDKSLCCFTAKVTKKARPGARNKDCTVDSQNIDDSQDGSGINDFQFGHFLFDNENYASTMSLGTEEQSTTEEDDYIDPSQFVQPVLEDPSPSQSRSIRASSELKQHHQTAVSKATRQIVSNQLTVTPFRPSHLRQTMVTSSAPRIIIRQGTIMKPGLVPINRQPNYLSGRNASSHIAVSQASSGSLVKNPASFLSNIEGARSYDQIQSLEQVPWFRDSIDSVRAVGFALNKRIRELEARFHSLKNKQDVEKVMLLGKKMERLTSKTLRRYKEINLSLREASRNWCSKKAVVGIQSQGNPFNLYLEGLSDWDDDIELERPLEKVMIPVNTSTLQSAGIRPANRSVVGFNTPPPLVRTSAPGTIHFTRVIRPPVTMRPLGSGPAPIILGQKFSPLLQPSTNSTNKPAMFTKVRLPGPKSGAVHYRRMPNSGTVLKVSNAANVGAYINKRNGTNSISITLAPPVKRQRCVSGGSDSSDDIIICPTIPELLEKNNIKPCRVILTKCDDFIEKFLEKQEELRRLNVSPCEFQVVGDAEERVLEPLPEVETVLVLGDNSVQTSESLEGTVLPDAEMSERPRNNTTDSIDHETVNSEQGNNDDDIEIIHEASQLNTNENNSPDLSLELTVEGSDAILL